MDNELLRERLLAFYDERKRDLPWRRTRDPYRIWVSEVMLQQTRVDTVIPYYRRWLERFPTVLALADADEEAVLGSWKGLGYYSRARNLHRAAQVVRDAHAGQVPSDPTALRALPGVGEYTAGALASIAFGLPEPVVDGNVRRVLARLHDLEAPTPARLRALTTELLDRDRPGDFNQALMELGATVCTPRAPECGSCPWSAGCAALAAGTVELRPVPKVRGPLPEVRIRVSVLARWGADGQPEFLLQKRPPTGLLAGMWEFPGEELEGADAPPEEALAGDPLPPLTHTFTHLRAHYLPVLLDRDGGPPEAEGATRRWVSVAETVELALPVAQGKILASALERLHGVE
jgi:A/G-specific adenine glycosylase